MSMAMREREPQEPVPLVKRARSHDEWFAQAHEERVSEPPRSSSVSLVPLASSSRAWWSGAFAGVVSSVVGLVVATVVGDRVGEGARIQQIIAHAFVGDRLTGGAADAVGYAAVIVVGALVGAALSRATRHVERTFPMALFGLLFAPIAWFSVHVLVLARVAPLLAHTLPLGALLAGAAAFGALLSLAVPLRRPPRAGY